MADEQEDSRGRDLLMLVLIAALAYQLHWSILAIYFWYVGLKVLEKRGLLDRWNCSRMLGIILMVRTGRGQVVLDLVSKPKKFWRLFGEIGLWTCRGVSALVLIFFVLTFILTLMNPGEIEPSTASELVLIPGVSPTIPLVWGLCGLIVALVIHEYGHGILTRAHGMRVKSFGLLILGLIPIGAFAEPEGRELMRAPRKERQRVFAAGPAINLYGGLAFFFVLALVANGMTATISGVHADGIIAGQPANEAGIEAWELIIEADGSAINNYQEFTIFLDSHQSGDNITLTLLSIPDENGERTQRIVPVTLADQYQYQLGQGWTPEILAAYGVKEGDAFLGVSGLASNDAGAIKLAGPLAQDASKEPLPLIFGFATQPLKIIFSPIENKGEIMHAQELELLESSTSLPTSFTFALLHILFWIIWMNILLGFANLIPIIPFDGGHLMRDRLHDYFEFFSKFKKNSHPISVRESAHKLAGYSSLILAGMMIAMVLLPLLI